MTAARVDREDQRIALLERAARIAIVLAEVPIEERPEIAKVAAYLAGYPSVIQLVEHGLGLVLRGSVERRDELAHAVTAILELDDPPR